MTDTTIASSSGIAAGGSATRYNIPGATPLEGVAPIPAEDVGEISKLPPYNLLNGNAEDITPYLLTGTLPVVYHWVPVNNIEPSQAITCVDGYIRSHLHHINAHRPATLSVEDARLAAIVLGTARAVLTANFGLTHADLIPKETASPSISATIGENDTVSYTVLSASNEAGRNYLTAALTLNDTEKAIMGVVAQCAQAIMPLQGLNLMTDGHHYLSATNKSSYRAFLAVERQLWVSDTWKTAVSGKETTMRDLMWHKSGHPVHHRIKELAATSMKVKENLVSAGMGGAAARLPALEADVRAATTYVKLMASVDAVWRTMGGGADVGLITERIDAVKMFPRDGGGAAVTPTVELNTTSREKVLVRNRKEALDELRRVVERNAANAAVAYGFYCAMMDAIANESTVQLVDTLRLAFSLKKLALSETGGFSLGAETYKDYRAQRGKARAEGTVTMPIIIADA